MTMHIGAAGHRMADSLIHHHAGTVPRHTVASAGASRPQPENDQGGKDKERPAHSSHANIVVPATGFDNCLLWRVDPVRSAPAAARILPQPLADYSRLPQNRWMRVHASSSAAFDVA